MIARSFICTICLTGFVLVASADTVFLKNGTSVDGKVSNPNDNCIAVDGGGGQTVFQTSEVDHIEKNNKTSAHDLSVFNPLSNQHEKMMEEQTGLTTEQRETVLQAVEALRTDDEGQRSAIIKKLAGLQREVNIFGFLESSMASFGARLVPGVLDTLSTIDPKRARPIIESKATDIVPENRAAALKSLARLGDKSAVNTIIRGMVDVSPKVQIASAESLGQIKQKSATPVLVEILKSNDIQVRNASMAALSRIWSTDKEIVQFSTPDEWRTFWEQNHALAGSPIDMAKLEPLYVPAPGSYVIVHE